MNPYIELTAGLYFIGFAAAMNTTNLLSLMVFRVVPALFGAAIALDAVTRLGWTP